MGDERDLLSVRWSCRAGNREVLFKWRRWQNQNLRWKLYSETLQLIVRSTFLIVDHMFRTLPGQAKWTP